jgi:hypothetical protein
MKTAANLHDKGAKAVKARLEPQLAVLSVSRSLDSWLVHFSFSAFVV